MTASHTPSCAKDARRRGGTNECFGGERCGGNLERYDGDDARISAEWKRPHVNGESKSEHKLLSFRSNLEENEFFVSITSTYEDAPNEETAFYVNEDDAHALADIFRTIGTAIGDKLSAEHMAEHYRCQDLQNAIPDGCSVTCSCGTTFEASGTIVTPNGERV